LVTAAFGLLFPQPSAAQDTCNGRQTTHSGSLRPGLPIEGFGLFALPREGSRDIVEIDPANGSEIGRFRAPETGAVGAEGLAFDGRRIWFFDGNGGDSLYEIDPDTGTAVDEDLIPIGSGNYNGLAVLGDEVFVLDATEDDIIVFDATVDLYTRILDVDALDPSVDLADGLTGIGGPDALLVAGRRDGEERIFEIDPATGAVTNSFRAPVAGPSGLAAFGGEIYVDTGSSIQVLNRAGAVQRQISLPYAISALGGDGTSPGGILRAQVTPGRVTTTRGDVYGVVVCETGTYTFSMCSLGGSAEFDTHMCLFNGAGELVSENDNACDEPSEISATLEPGAYSLAISGADDASGNFRLASYADVANECRSCNQRSLLVREAIAPSTDPQTVTGSIGRSNGEMFPFEVTEQRLCTFSFCSEAGNAEFDSTLCLLDDAGVVVSESDDSCGRLSQMQPLLDPGTYVIAVSASGSNSGSYTLEYSWIEPPAVLEFVCNGRRMFDGGRLTPTTVPQIASGSVLTETGRAYQFTVEMTACYTFSFCADGATADFDTVLCLLDGRGGVVAQNDSACGQRSQIITALDPGEYVVAVSGDGQSAGNYSLGYSRAPAPCPIRVDCNRRSLDQLDDLQPTTAVGTVRGAVTASVGDVYGFDACEAGTYTFTFCRDGGAASYDPWLCLFDSNGTLIMQNDDTCGLLSEVFADLTPGRYFVAVSGFSSSAGTYTLAYDASVPNVCEETVTIGPFLRGDCNGDGIFAGQVSDAVFLLNFNFAGGPPPPCGAACDVDVDGGITGAVADAISMLNFNFFGGPAPAAPFPECGSSDRPADIDLGCETPPDCE